MADIGKNIDLYAEILLPHEKYLGLLKQLPPLMEHRNIPQPESAIH